jgi:DNA polymerase-3 subunit epsilon
MNLPELEEDDQPDHAAARQAAATWARQVLADPRCVVLDTETTGLDSRAEIIELAVLAPDGTVLYNSRFRPAGPIPREATAIHGIRDADVAGAPTFAECWALGLRALLADKRIVTYNADFDSRLLLQTLGRYGLTHGLDMGFDCAMMEYAAFVGDWSDWHGNYRYKSLAFATSFTTADQPDHTALGDARACLAVVRQMAASAADEETPA